jgi:hypothetical protein
MKKLLMVISVLILVGGLAGCATSMRPAPTSPQPENWATQRASAR